MDVSGEGIGRVEYLGRSAYVIKPKMKNILRTLR